MIGAKGALRWIRDALQTYLGDPARYRYVYVPRREAGVVVDEETAIQYAAVFACVRVISETIAMLPWQVLESNAEGTRTRHLRRHQVQRMLNRRASRDHGAMATKETLIASALLSGNGYAEIERDGAGRAVGLWPISSDRVEPRRRDNETREIYYEVNNSVGEKTELASRNVFHLHGLGWDGLLGYSIVSLARRTIGTGLAADNFGAAFYGNGTIVGSIIEHPNRIGEEALKRIKESIEENRRGATNAFKPMILEEGMKWNNVTIPAKDAQFLESNQFRVEEVARWFRVPPHKIAHLLRATFSNIEHQSIEFVTDTLMPWITRLEEEADYKLFGQSNGSIYTRINVNALLRGDMETRAKFYKDMSSMGAFSINDILEMEDMDPIPDGDVRLVPVNMTTLERLSNEPSDSREPDDEEPDGQEPDTPAPEQAVAILVAAAEARALAYEEKHLGRSLSLYETRGEFIEWMDPFFSEQKTWRADRILTALDHGDLVTGAVTIMVRDFVGSTIRERRLEALDRFDQRRSGRMKPGDIKHRADEKARTLLVQLREVDEDANSNAD